MFLAYILFALAVIGLLGGAVLGVWMGGFDGVFAGVMVGAFSVGIFGGMAYSAGHTNYSERTIACTVTEKDRGGDDGSYRVYTNECGVLANYDSMIWHGKTNSSDVWNQIKPGSKYNFRVVGWRFEPLSSFPNILKVG